MAQAREVEACLRLIDGRATLVPLLERAAALDAIADIADLGVAEIHVGLNDLSIDLGLESRLAALVSPFMTRLSERARAAGLRLCVGGLARAHDDALPVASDLVYAQHARLGSRGALLARSFLTRGLDEAGFAIEIARLRRRIDDWSAASPEEIEAAHRRLRALTSGQGR